MKLEGKVSLLLSKLLLFFDLMNFNWPITEVTVLFYPGQGNFILTINWSYWVRVYALWFLVGRIDWSPISLPCLQNDYHPNPHNRPWSQEIFHFIFSSLKNELLFVHWLNLTSWIWIVHRIGPFHFSTTSYSNQCWCRQLYRLMPT